MSNYKYKNKQKNYIPLIALAIILSFALVIGISIKFGNSNKLEGNEKGNVVINTEKIGSRGSYFTYNYEGTNMEFFAVRDPNGNVRLAFNRCQVCFDSGKGYFIQEGDEFVCQNCGNRYRVTSIGTEKGGCNPSPISNVDKIVSEDIIEIKKSIFAENKFLFI